MSVCDVGDVMIEVVRGVCFWGRFLGLEGKETSLTLLNSVVHNCVL